MKNIYAYDVKKILYNYVLVLIPILLLTMFLYNNSLENQLENTKNSIIQEQQEKSKLVNYIFEDIFNDVCEDFFIVRDSNEFFDYLGGFDTNNRDDIAEIEGLFLRVLKNKSNFYKLTFMDHNGKTLIEGNNNESEPYLSDYSQLENRSSELSYLNTLNLFKNEIYISNISVMKSKEYKDTPFIKLSAPLYSKMDEYRGLLIVDYLANDFFDSFKNQFIDTKYSFVSNFLINNDGNYIYDKDSGKSFSVPTKNLNIWNYIKNNEEDFGIYEDGNEIYYFNKINPIDQLNAKNIKEYNWYIISKFSTDDFQIKNVTIGELLSFIFFMIIVLIIVSVHYFSKKDKEELNITKKIAENTSDAVLITDHKTNIIYVNKAFENYTGYKKDEVLGLKTNFFKSNKQSDEFYKKMWNDINNIGIWHGELWDRKKDGMLYPKKLSIFSIKDDVNKKSIKYIGIFRDLTENKKNEEYVNKLKNYNYDTNLPNENLLVKLIENSINKNNREFFTIYFTIENYNILSLKIQNKENHFIKILIERIKNMIGEDDFIAQISKNYFVMGISSFESRIKLNEFMKNFLKETAKLIYIDGIELLLNIKAGISIYPDNSTDANELIFDSYITLEKVLGIKEKNFLYYNVSFKNEIKKEMEINILLKKAIINNEFDVYYQPQVRISDEKVVGVEALIRWNNPSLGNVSPAIFIPIAEKSGQIIEIGYWLMDRICRDVITIKNKLSDDIRVSINISPLQFKDKDLIPTMNDMLEKFDVSPNNFEIEITEGVLMTDNDVEYINFQLDQFRIFGLTLAIDDFGTGFSSLSYLKKLNIDKLKIDRSFIKDYPEKDNGEIAELITNISKKLNLKIIAEGAETLEQVNYLQSIGCNYIQGFYYSKPLPLDELIKYIKK